MSQASDATQTIEKKLAVLVVDDHALLNETLVTALEQDKYMKVDAVTTVDDAISRVADKGRYDAILVDYGGPGMDGLEGLQKLTKVNKGSVALFSGIAGWSVVERAIKGGACGFIPKASPLKALRHAIRFIADGEIYLPSGYMLRKSSEKENTFDLKPREFLVLECLCKGMQNKEIGREMDIQETVVKMTVRAICQKMGVRNRTQAVIKAIKHDLC